MRSKHVLMAATVLLLTGCGFKKYQSDEATVPPPGGNQEEQDQQLPTFTRHCLAPASSDIATTIEAIKTLAGTTDCRAAQKMLSEQSSITLKGMKLGSLEPLSGLKSLKHLDLSETGISQLSDLEGLSALETLKVNGNSLKEGVPMAGFPALKNLEAADSQIEGTAWLSETCQLTRLELSGNALGDFSGIKNCQSLKDLGLARTQMKDTDSSELQSLAALGRLNVASNELTSVAFAEQLKALADIDAANNKITSLESLTKLSALKTLSFTGNPVMAWSKTYPKSCPVTGTASPALSAYCGTLLKKHQPFHWTCLNVLAESDPRRKTVDAVYVALAMKGKNCEQAQDLVASQKELKLDGQGITALGPLAKLSNLESLNIRANGLEGKGSLESLVGLTALKSLDLSRNAMPDGINFAQFPALESLTLSDSGITSTTWLPENCALTALNLSSNALVDVSAISRCKNLTDLNLYNAKFTDENVQEAGIPALTALKTLGLTQNAITSLAFASTLTKLETLNASNNKITSVEPLKDIATLAIIRMNGNRVNTLASLKAHKGLKELGFVANPVLKWDTTYADRCPSVDTGSKALAKLCMHNLKMHNGFLWHCLTVRDPSDSRYHVVDRVLRAVRESPDDCTKGYAKLQSQPAKIKRNLNLSASQALPKLSNIQPLHDDVFKFVRRVSFDNNDINTLTPLTTWPGLKYLSVNNNPLQAMAPLRFFPNLRELRLANTHLKRASFITAGHPLEKLFINGPKLETYTGIEKLTQLTSIQLARSPLVKELGSIESMSQLRGLNIMANPQFTSFDFSKFPKLEYLGLVDQSSTAGYLAGLGLPGSLKHLDARFNAEDTASFNSLPAAVPNLVSLNVFGNEGVKSLAKMKELGVGEWDNLDLFCANSITIASKKECPTSKVPRGIAAYCRGEGSGLPGCPATVDGYEVEPFEAYLSGAL